MELEIGTKATIEFKVKASDLAKNLEISPEDDFPEVFATARLTALMECASAKILIPFYKEGEFSVGVEVGLKHLAPTLEGDIVKATATFVGMEGKLYKFEVEAFDSGGKVGEATHTRAIVSKDRLMAGANKRVEK
ncbi:thioesterase [Halarcobacter mediterraneus]|uniref:Thioesterase n=1 Tax=Halarcobacter mediterraneus TaxID=2023153 RepID=A0A4Q1B4J8_9BACT|nr:hotdog domain-containing protein [Halarcobacter mediterraneus]RXK13997.1 thioesterase [Halarcobacter mediterraneus]